MYLHYSVSAQVMMLARRTMLTGTKDCKRGGKGSLNFERDPEDDSNDPETELQQPDDVTDLNYEEPSPPVEALLHSPGELSIYVQPPELMELKEKLLHTEGDLKKVNEKVTSLEGCLEAAKDVIEITEMKLKEAVEKLRKSEEEKVLLMRQLHQASSMALKIKNDDKQTHLFTGLPSCNVFVLILTILPHLLSRKRVLVRV